MINEKLHSPAPYFILVGLLGLVPVLNNMYPSSFFPAVPAFWVELVSVVGGVIAAFLGLSRFWVKLERKKSSEALISQAVQMRNPAMTPEENDLVIAGRSISRLARNADEDLREINADFSLESLERLQAFLPALVREVEKLGDARVRLGVVGTYLGETLCRNLGFKWFFRTDPSLRQFSYLASIVQREGKELDPYALAGDLLAGKRKMADFLREAKAGIQG